MRISFNTPVASAKIGGHNGYGYATQCMLSSLAELGYEVNDNDPKADVQFAFNQPQHWNWQGDAYRIGYHPWESTQLLPGWAEIMNECDEIWTPSPLIATWYKEYAGIKVPVYVYEHGIEHHWKAVKRQPEKTIKFLHVGGEATRKGGWETVRLFRQAFPNRNDVSLTMKMQHTNWMGVPNLGRVQYINERYTLHDLQLLFYVHDVYIYPSWGEGFGLTPLQAMATGMPTIVPTEWAPYKRFVDPSLAVSSTLAKSPWQDIHPGKMLRPSKDDIIESMRYVADNYDKARDFACEQSFDIHSEYDWNELTREAFEALEARLASR